MGFYLQQNSALLNSFRKYTNMYIYTNFFIDGWGGKRSRSVSGNPKEYCRHILRHTPPFSASSRRPCQPLTPVKGFDDFSHPTCMHAFFKAASQANRSR